MKPTVYCAGIAFAALLACGGQAFVVHRIPDLAPEPAAVPSVTVRLPKVDVDNGRDEVVLEVLATDTLAIIQSDEFKRFVARMTFASRTAGSPVPGTDVLRDYLGETGRLGATVPLHALGRSWSSIAITYFVGDQVHIGLRTPVIERAGASSPETRACAINSLAHELVHAVIDRSSGAPDHAYQDGGHASEARPLASYAIGAIAQCAYLRKHVDAKLDMVACVENAGISSFNPGSCHAGWVAELRPGAAPKPMPAPAIPDTNFWSTIDVLCANRDTAAMQLPAFATVVQLCEGKIGAERLIPGDDELHALLDAIKIERAAARAKALASRRHTLIEIFAGDGGVAERVAALDAQLASIDQTTLAVDDIPRTGAQLGGVLAAALVDVVSGRVKAELQAYAVDTVRRVACGKRKAWFAATCAMVATDSDELPLAFGVALRSALIEDLAQVPARAIAVPAVGARAQLVATLFAGTVSALMRRADIATVAAEWTRVTETVFACDHSADADCARVLHAAHFAGRAALAVLQGRGTATDALVQTLVELAAQDGLSLPPGEPAELIAKVVEARRLGEALFAASGAERAAQVKPLVEAVVAVVDHVFAITGTEARLPGGIPDLVDALARGDVTPMVTVAFAVLRDLRHGGVGLDSKALRLLAFAGELARAKDESQATAAIEAVIAPVGTHRLKRTQPMASITAFVGLSAGKERLSGSPLAGDEDAESTTIAPAGYVGFDLSMPLHNRVVPHVGLFVPVVDVGSLLNFRSDDAKAELAGGGMAEVGQASNVGFVQLLSPGLYLRAGIGGTPLVIGAGASFVPEARRVTSATGAVDDDVSAIRWNVFAAVDVTLLPFHL